MDDYDGDAEAAAIMSFAVSRVFHSLSAAIEY